MSPPGALASGGTAVGMSVEIALVQLEETSTTLAFLGDTHWFWGRCQIATSDRKKNKREEEIRDFRMKIEEDPDKRKR
jgi:hypothetical protein